MEKLEVHFFDCKVEITHPYLLNLSCNGTILPKFKFGVLKIYNFGHLVLLQSHQVPISAIQINPRL